LAQKKYYVVKIGRETGIFNTWADCKSQIDGYSGAVYKKFADHEEACKFLNGEDKKLLENQIYINNVEAYVDGSYSKEIDKYSYGCVILNKNEIIKFNGIGNIKEYALMRNVAGELLGAMKAIKWAYENKCDSITILYDYEGIEKWANGTWKTKKKGTLEYLEFINKYKEYLNINFKKVLAHSGDFYNEEADKLAKQALQADFKLLECKKKHLDNRIEIFNKIMILEDKNKNSVNFLFENYLISESKLKKFIKEVWKLDGNNKSDIENININFDIKSSKVKWNIKDKQGKEQDFEMYI